MLLFNIDYFLGCNDIPLIMYFVVTCGETILTFVVTWGETVLTWGVTWGETILTWGVKTMAQYVDCSFN